MYSNGIPRSRSERFSRSSGLGGYGYDVLSPIKAIVHKIKDLSQIGINAPNQSLASPVGTTSTYLNTAVRFESVMLGRQAFNVRRVCVVGENRYNVAWVVDSDLKICMICRATFGWTRFRHHCR